MSACPANLAPRRAVSPVPHTRTMRPADLDQVAAIENRIYDFPWSRDVFLSCFTPDYENLVMELERRVIGYGMMWLAAGDCHVVNLCMDIVFQGRGLGRVLFRRMLDNAAAHGARRAMLEVRPSNAPALSLYASEQFNEVSLRRNYYPTANGREDALVLTRLL